MLLLMCTTCLFVLDILTVLASFFLECVNIFEGNVIKRMSREKDSTFFNYLTMYFVYMFVCPFSNGCFLISEMSSGVLTCCFEIRSAVSMNGFFIFLF